MKRALIGLASICVVCVALLALWSSLVPDTNMPANFVATSELDLRSEHATGTRQGSPAPEGAPKTENPAQPLDQGATAEQLRRALEATPFPGGETKVRIRIVDLAVHIPPQPPCPPSLGPGDMYDGMRCPHPDDPPFVALTDDEFRHWRDESVLSVTDAVFVCGGGRVEMICDDQACAMLQLDGAYNQRDGYFRRPAMILEQIGHWMGLPAEIDRCGHARNQIAHARLSRGTSCYWFRPPAASIHRNRVGEYHGQALCDVLAPPVPTL